MICKICGVNETDNSDHIYEDCKFRYNGPNANAMYCFCQIL